MVNIINIFELQLDHPLAPIVGFPSSIVSHDSFLLMMGSTIFLSLVVFYALVVALR
jgi:hypothetical protein